jgi:hypothetical protein
MAVDTTFDLLAVSQEQGVLGFNPTQLTIANNATSSVGGIADTFGAGVVQIEAEASATGINDGFTGFITIQPSITSVANGSGTANSTTPITLAGLNFTNATGISAPTGITATITNIGGTTLNASVQVANGVTSGPYTLTLLTPGGNVNFTFTVQ